MHTNSTARLRSSSTLALASLALLLAACPGDDTSVDTEATTGSSTTGSSTDGGPGPDPDTSGGAESSSSTTAAVDDTSTTGDPDSTTGDPPADGTCIGIDEVGTIASVLSRDGMPIDTTCDPTPAPCGGDPVGTWALEGSCGFEALPNPLEAMCPSSTFMLTVVSEMGTMTFEADGSFVQDFEIQSEALLTLDPMECFGVDCPTFEGILQMDAPGITCQAMGPTCECTLPDNGMSEQVMGTWEVMDTNLVLTTPDGPGVLPFCIAGDRLDLWQSILGTPVPTDTLCMDDQDCVDAIGDMYDFAVCSLDDMPGG
jgi:hypothetical protein